MSINLNDTSSSALYVYDTPVSSPSSSSPLLLPVRYYAPQIPTLSYEVRFPF